MDREGDEELEAGMKRPVPAAGHRQRRQKSRAKLYHYKDYKKNRGKLKAKARRRYKRVKNRGWFKRDQKFRNKYPEKYMRRPGGGYLVPAKRTKDWRNDKKRTPFKRTAETTDFPPMPIYIDPPDAPGEEGGSFGQVCGFDDDTDMVTFDTGDGRETLDLGEFIACTSFLDEEDLNYFFDMLDEVFEYEPDPEGVASRYLSDATEQDEMEEPSPERVAEFYRKQVWNPQRSDDSREPRGVPDGDDATKNDYEGLPSWMGPIKDERENPTPAHGMPVDRDRPGAPGSAKVIPRGQGFAGRTANRQIVAMKMAEILSGTGPNVHSKAMTLTVKMNRVVPKSAMWLFNVSGGENTHRVRLQAVRKGNNKTLSKADVRISCDCNFWQWQGPEHWAKAGGYLYGRPRGTASSPDIRDPGGQHLACKHVLAVLRKAEDYSFRSRKEVQRAITRSKELDEQRRLRRSKTAAMDALVGLLFPSVGRVTERYLARSGA